MVNTLVGDPAGFFVIPRDFITCIKDLDGSGGAAEG